MDTTQDTKKSAEAPKTTVLSSQKDIEENKGITVLSYIGVLFLVPLLVKKDSPFAQFHAKQGLALFVCTTITSMLMGFLAIFGIIPIIGWIIFFLGFLVWIVVLLILLVFAIIGIIHVLQGKTEPIPIIGSLPARFHI